MNDLEISELKKQNSKLIELISELLLQKKEDKLIKLPTVIEYVGLKKTTIFNLINENKFPAPMKFGGNSLWRMSSIQNYINNLDEELL